MQEKAAPKEWQMKIMQKLMVQEWSRDYQKQVTRVGYGCPEVKKIEPQGSGRLKRMTVIHEGNILGGGKV